MPKHVIGCTLWSLAMPDTVESIRAAAKLGFKAIQFTFRQDSDVTDDGLARIRQALRETGLEVSGGMVYFADEDYSTIQSIRATGGFIDPKEFPKRLDICRRWARAHADLGIRHVTTHVGFIPEPSDERHSPFMDRLAQAMDALHEPGLTVGLETGQEPADLLIKTLDELGRKWVSVNFDPANFVLYGSDDPVRAASLLGPRTSIAHMKDGRKSAKPGEVWGDDVPLGTGDVPFKEVIAALEAGGFAGPLIIEREAGNDRLGDIGRGKTFLEGIL